MGTELSAITVTWNSARFIGGCLGSLINEVSEIRSEIIVVDNDSSDDTAGIVESDYPGVALIRNRENLGFGAANNQGIRLSKGEFVLLLNPDTVVHPGALKEMLRFLRDNPPVGMVGPEQLDGEGGLHLNFSRLTLRGMVEYLLEKLAPSSWLASSLRTPYEVKYLNGSCWLVRREVFGDCGLYDEGLFLYGEEPDMCSRIRRAGWRMFFVRSATITHYRGRSIEQIGWRKQLHLVRSFSRLVRKSLPTSSWESGQKPVRLA